MLRIAMCCLLAVTFVGCQQQSGTQTSSATGEVSPVDTVNQFLTALRSGDEQGAATMLTIKAQQEAAQKQMAFQPPGSPNARFTITEFEYVGPAKKDAHVLSTWTDIDSQGVEQTYEIVWVLRHEQRGWGVAGMATKVLDNQPLILNFEDQADMARRRQYVEQEVARRRQQSQVQQAQRQSQPPRELQR